MPSDLFSLPFEDDRRRPAQPPPPERRVLTVTELTAAIRGLLETSFGDVWVEGEISNCRVWNTGHMYFTLKDGGAQIKAVMFRSAVRYLKFKVEDGQHVVARGRLGVYDPKGEYQIVCEHLEPRGLGALQLAFEQLKKRLQAEGLFDPARKRPLPSLPRKIGIVTSLDGAAIRDIIQVLRRRHPNAHLVIRPTRVQGDGAADDIARALRAIAKVPGVDVVIAGRGGGSIEDLWAFNEEIVARAIAACPVPVISAVGHEVDFTIADFVADLRAPTPSAAAELVVAAKDDFCAARRSAGASAAGSRQGGSAAAAGARAYAGDAPRRGRMAGPARDARPARRRTDPRTASGGDRAPGAARARLQGAQPPSRVARPAAAPRGHPRAPVCGRRPDGICRRTIAPSRRCTFRRRRRAPGVAQPARRARTRIRRLLERRSHRDHPQRLRRRPHRARAGHVA